MTYSEKLRDPRWQKKRLKIMERDEFMCQKCQDKDSTLNVHHRIYFKEREPWEYEDWCLVTLCETCHHDEMESECGDAGLVHALKEMGFYNSDISDFAISIHEGKLSFPVEVFTDFFYRFLKNKSLQQKCFDVYFDLLKEQNAKIKKSNG